MSQSYETILLNGFNTETLDRGVSSFDESGHDVGLLLLELLEDGVETNQGANFELKLEQTKVSINSNHDRVFT